MPKITLISPFLQYFKNERIFHECSCVNTSQENGVVEPKNGHHLNITRALLFNKHVTKGEVALIAAHLINRFPTSILDFKTPI